MDRYEGHRWTALKIKRYSEDLERQRKHMDTMALIKAVSACLAIGAVAVLAIIYL